jgi:hypothetical protein
VIYDFEQAKLPGRTGWVTQNVGNELASDLVPGFTLRLSHELWEGPVGFQGTKFKPFLSSVSTAFSITENTVRAIGAFFGLGEAPRSTQPTGVPSNLGMGGVPGSGDIRRNTLLQPSQLLSRGSGGFNANITLNIQRTRPVTNPDGSVFAPPSNSSIGFNTRFAPTKFWGVTWSTNYNTAQKQFEAQQLQLTRDLHEWRAAFNFVRAPNGNFTFYFAVFLMDFPDINYKYNQTTIER